MNANHLPCSLLLKQQQLQHVSGAYITILCTITQVDEVYHSFALFDGTKTGGIEMPPAVDDMCALELSNYRNTETCMMTQRRFLRAFTALTQRYYLPSAFYSF
jgi:hypothetical protein